MKKELLKALGIIVVWIAFIAIAVYNIGPSIEERCAKITDNKLDYDTCVMQVSKGEINVP